MSFLHFDYAQCKITQEFRFHTGSPLEFTLVKTGAGMTIELNTPQDWPLTLHS